MEENQIDERHEDATSPWRLKQVFSKMDEPTEDKIPYTTHYVWLTNTNQPKEMTDMIDATENIGYSHHIGISMNTLKSTILRLISGLTLSSPFLKLKNGLNHMELK